MLGKYLQQLPYYLLVTIFTVTASFQAHGFSRIDASKKIGTIESSWADNSVDAWINDFRGTSDSGILVGDGVTLATESAGPGHFLFILVDSKGAVSIFKPPSGAAESYQTFPELAQDAPVGEQYLYSVVSTTEIPASVLGTDSQHGYRVLGRDEQSLVDLVRNVNAHSSQYPTTISERFNYVVDDPNVALQTRGMKVGVKKVGVKKPSPAPVLVSANDQEPEITATAGLALDIKFDYNESTLTGNGKLQLDTLGSVLVSLMADDSLPSYVLEGHTDSSGEWDYNMSLSQQRAQSARNYLAQEFDIPLELIQSRGMGEDQPVRDNTTAAGRSANRRVELKIAQ